MTTIEPGQFDDAPDNISVPISRHAEHVYIDMSDSDSTPNDSYSDEYDDYSDNRVEDEDWEIAEKDFTKQYNRLRQHVAVRSGNAQGTMSSLNQKSAVAVLPPVNYPQSRQQNTQQNAPKDKTTDQLAALAKFSSRLAKIDMPYSAMGVGVNRKGPSASANIKDKADRATNEQVLDPRTRLILFKMINKGLIHEVNGCISTGKEANVYHALTPPEINPCSAVPNRHVALKIYKTSILVFKDRDKYVSGEHRFRRGYSRHNPRKMVRMWAEKEMRNLKRLTSAGLRAPEAIEVRENVLVMDFLGDGDGWPSSRLKDAELTRDQCDEMYIELLLSVRIMFHQCQLVHADLSEYNILLHDGHLWIIDVSQSVEHDHPAAFDFLRNDLKNVEEFFGRRGVKCLGLRRAFEFVTTEHITDKNAAEAEILAQWRDEVDVGDPDENNGEHKTDAHEEEIFRKSYIPRSLNDLYDPERDAAAMKRGDADKLIYADTIGLVDTSKEPGPSSSKAVHFDSDSDSDSDDEASGSEEDRGDFKDRKPRGHRNEDKDAKKERKKAVKAEAREKRKHKMPKAEKKRSIKKGRG